MSDVIERIKKRIEDVQSKLDRSVFCDYDNAKYDGYECALIIIDEELAKEPQECKWFKYDYRTIAPKNHDVENPYWRIPENMDKLKYCPYCGRKIKVIE